MKNCKICGKEIKPTQSYLEDKIKDETIHVMHLSCFNKAYNMADEDNE